MAPPPNTAEAPAATPDARSWMERLWSSIADRGRSHASALRPGAPVAPLDRTRGLADALLSERGEASGAAVARELMACLRTLATEDRLAFYRYVSEGFLPAEAPLRAAAQAYLDDPTPGRAAALADAAEPSRQELLRRMNMAPGGTAALVELRKDLLAQGRGDSALHPLDADMRHLFASWFNRGFLDLRRIDWQTPAAVLEKLIAYEAVHEIEGWDDLRRRLAPDRRCFGFFHPALPGEPLIFVEVALTTGLATAIQPLLAREGEEQAQRDCVAAADTAIFYSISNCQDGLRGVSFGNFLIKQVVEELQAELPGITRFSTLSPVPGFRRWLRGRLGAEDRAGLLRDADAQALRTADDGTEDAAEALQHLLERENWPGDPAIAGVLEQVLPRLCTLYLTTPTAGGRPGDPVARFHLGNGARLERVNWLGNTAPRGMAESYGMMVNYLYDPAQIEANHEAFVRGTIVRSPAVDALLGAPSASEGSPARRNRKDTPAAAPAPAPAPAKT